MEAPLRVLKDSAVQPPAVSAGSTYRPEQRRVTSAQRRLSMCLLDVQIAAASFCTATVQAICGVPLDLVLTDAELPEPRAWLSALSPDIWTARGAVSGTKTILQVTAVASTEIGKTRASLQSQTSMTLTWTSRTNAGSIGRGVGVSRTPTLAVLAASQLCVQTASSMRRIPTASGQPLWSTAGDCVSHTWPASAEHAAISCAT